MHHTGLGSWRAQCRVLLDPPCAAAGMEAVGRNTALVPTICAYKYFLNLIFLPLLIWRLKLNGKAQNLSL